jgi:predicted GH43/DUF377 family glycosyl hydrolase
MNRHFQSNNMKKNLLFLISLLLASTSLCAAQDDLSWMRGANYVPSYARNDVQLWLEYDPAVIDRELGYAERLKLNTVRTFLNVAVFEKQPEKFMADFENFLSLADKHGLKAMPVLFDSCEDPQEVDVNNYKKTMRWIPSPGFSRLGDQDWPAMEKFIVALVGKYRDDKRIVLWDVMNEPESTRKWDKPEDRARIVEFVRRALKRVKAENPAAPIGIGWQRLGEIPLTADLSDVLVIHNYSDVNGLQANIRRIQEMGKTMNKPVILNEFVGRPQQRIEKALPIAAREKTGWCFWELMIGSTRFSQGKVPYQGHIYPDGTCFSAAEVAIILNPEGFTGDATEIARKAGFEVSEKAPKPFTDESITFSPSWKKWEGAGPDSGRLWHATVAGETATKEVAGTSVAVILKHGPDCGIATVTIDGKPAAVAEIDTYSKEVDWSKRTTVAKDLPPGKHTVVVTVTGRKTAASSNRYVQIVNITGLEPRASSGAQLSPGAAGGKVTAVDAAYRGWKTLALNNSLVELQILPAIGGRVIQFKMGDKDFLWVNPQLAGTLPPTNGLAADNGWFNIGGDKLWPAPQGWDNDRQWPGPPDAVLDGQPYAMEKLSGGGKEASVRLTSGDDKRSGICFSRVITLRQGSTHVSFDATMKNIDTQPRRWGIWSHTQCDGGSKDGKGHNEKLTSYCRLNPASHFTNGYTVIFGDEKNPSFQPDRSNGLMRVQYLYKVGKVGLDCPAGWIASVDGENGRVFVQRFSFEAGKEYPDGASVEFWMNGTGSFRAWGKDNVMPDDPAKNPYVHESEMISPFTQLKPGESYTWKYDWYASTIGGDYPIVDCTPVGITAGKLGATNEGGNIRLRGRFGVFAEGRLELRLLDASGRVVRTERSADTVSPLQPVVFDKVVTAESGITSAVLWLNASDGAESGELARSDDLRIQIAPPSPAEKASVERLKQPPMYYGDATRLGRPFAKDPSVIRFGGRYLMYYSIAAWAKELAPPGAPRGWAIGIAESRDLVNWKKVGEILPEQECEKNGIVNGRIILLDGKLHLFYNSYGNGSKDALCHATSEDGLHFTRNPSNPIWRPTGDWNNGRAIDVDVVEWGGQLIMYYATRDPKGRIQMLHAIAAPRKSQFNRADWKSLRDGPVLKPELPWEKTCIEAPSVIKCGDSLYLFYGGGYNNAPQQIGCATSKDGIHFQRLFIDKPLLPNGAPGTWNSSESGHPGMFEDDDGQLYMFYQANNDQGHTWFLSWVKIGWEGDRPRVIEQQKVSNP